jgi:hypothetical protein
MHRARMLCRTLGSALGCGLLMAGTGSLGTCAVPIEFPTGKNQARGVRGI